MWAHLRLDGFEFTRHRSSSRGKGYRLGWQMSNVDFRFMNSRHDDSFEGEGKLFI